MSVAKQHHHLLCCLMIAEECEIDQVLNHRAKPHECQPNHREYYVSWRGMGPEENEWLSEHKLKNAVDAVQSYLNGLQ